jgi:hypothetical protein
MKPIFLSNLARRCLAAASCGTLAFTLTASAYAWTCTTVDATSYTTGVPYSAGLWSTLPVVFYSGVAVPNTSNAPWSFRWHIYNSSYSDLLNGHLSSIYQPLSNGDILPRMGQGTDLGWYYLVPYTDNLGHLFASVLDGTYHLATYQIDTSDKFFQPSSVAFNNRVYVFYADTQQQYLRVASSADNGQTWTYGVIDGVGGPSGRYVWGPSAVVYNNVLRVYYRDESNHDLREATSTDGVNWTLSTIDGAGGTNGRILGDVGMSPSVVVTAAGLCVVSLDQTDGTLRYGIFNGTSWTSFGVVDGGYSNPGNYGQIAGASGVGSAVEQGGVPHVYYMVGDYSTGVAHMRGAYWASGHFSAFDIDYAASGNACGATAIPSGNSTIGAPKALRQSNGAPMVYYTSPSHGLRVAY